MSDSAAWAAAAVLAEGLGKKSPLTKAQLVIWPLSVDAQGRPRRGAAPAIPPLVPEPLPPRWLSCLLALSHFASVVAQHGSLHTRPVLHEARYHLCASPTPCNTGNHTKNQFFCVPSAEYQPIQPLLPQKLCLASERPCCPLGAGIARASAADAPGFRHCFLLFNPSLMLF